MPIIDLLFTRLFYETNGEGDAVVLIPGFASGAWSWSWQAKYLAKDLSVVTFDPRGISRSVAEAGVKVTIPQLAEDISVLLDALEIASANILGISFGGFVAQEFAVRFPERVDRLVLASTSFGGPNHIMPSAEVLEPFSAADGLNSSEKIRRHLQSAFMPEFIKEKPEEVDLFCRLREENHVPEAIYNQQLAAAYEFNIEDAVGSITARTLVVTGARDTVVPKQNSINLASNIPNSRLEIIEEAGHMVFIEKAGEFNKLVVDFLTEE
ncbi:MAG: alpha/beta hydrolase [Acidobacteria bacterium]|nr:alpha/beta hydrolase [Acidobacteriota bacterium]